MLLSAFVSFGHAQTSALSSGAAVRTSTGSSAVAPANPVAPRAAVVSDLDDKHRLQAGDKLTFRVEEDQNEAPRTLTVTDTGEIELPFNFGRFTASNKTCKQLAQEIKAALDKDYYHNATVHLGVETRNTVRGKVYVSGQVSKPGPVTIMPDSPLMLRQAILLAGPPTQWAKLSAVRVVRQAGKETKTFVVDADAILNKGRLENDVVLEPDDYVIVPERGVVF